MAALKIFLSGVSGQFQECRRALASDLRAVGHEVTVQEDFQQHGHTLLEKLQQYIAGCDRVIALVGDAYGFEPDPAGLAAGTPRRSYAQWEYFFATGERLDGSRQPRKDLFVYFASPDYLRDNPVRQTPEAARLQQDFRALVRQSGKDHSPFGSLHELRALALRDGFSVPERRPQPVNLPYKTLGTLFKGRDQFLEDLGARLRAGDGRAVGVLAAQSIHGLGGVGKTRLAVEYAWRHQAEYTALLFVAADSPASLRRNLAELVSPLVLDLKEAQQAKEEEFRAAAATHWLEAHPGWFLILDNVDTEEVALEVEGLLTHLQHGHVVITSRLKAWGAGVEPLELDVLDAAAAAAFLLERTAGRRRPAAGDGTDAQALAAALDGLALALEQAGAYVSHVRCSLAEYLARWRQQEEQVLTWLDVRQMKYPQSVAITWETTCGQLSPPAAALLEILAWFAPDPVPEWVLLGKATHPLAVEALGGADVALALADLERYSLLKRQLTAERSSLLVHRLVQEVTRWRLPAEARHRRLAEALRLVDAVAIGELEDFRTWPVWVPLSPHVQALVDHAERAEIDQPTARLKSGLAVLLTTKALHADAEPLMRRALALDERTFGPDHPKVAIHLNNLAALLHATNRLAEAEPLMRRALAIDERGLGPEHPNVAIRLSNLAALLQATNRLAEAEPLLRRALAVAERSLGPEHSNVARDLNNLAQLLQDTNRLAEAEPLMRRALAIDERNLGSDHPEVAIDLNNLALLLKATNRLAEAEPLSQQAVAILLAYARRTGHQHPHLRTALANYRGILQALGRSSADIQERLDGLKAEKP
jgi:tetratricopeptide (TPR) repeat protein